MKFVRLIVVVLPITFLTGALADDAQFPLKPIPSVEELFGPAEPDVSEVAYACARGTALYLALSLYFEVNGVNDEDKARAATMKTQAEPFFRFAQAFGEASGKSRGATSEQVQILTAAYSKEMVRSKQLNNQILSAPIARDLEVIKRLSSLLQRLDAERSEEKSAAKDEAVSDSIQLAPLSESTRAIDWKNPNPSQVAYVGARAGALYATMAAAARTGTKERDKEMGDTLERRARAFAAVGRAFELKNMNGSSESFDKRLLLFGERYSAIMRESKELNNNFFPPFVQGDVEAALSVWPHFEALAASEFRK